MTCALLAGDDLVTEDVRATACASSVGMTTVMNVRGLGGGVKAFALEVPDEYDLCGGMKDPA